MHSGHMDQANGMASTLNFRFYIVITFPCLSALETAPLHWHSSSARRDTCVRSACQCVSQGPCKKQVANSNRVMGEEWTSVGKTTGIVPDSWAMKSGAGTTSGL